jgi:DNA polymerase (family 10)
MTRRRRAPPRGIANPEIAAALAELADALELEGANPFRVRAYRSGARAVERLGQPVAALAAAGGAAALEAIPDIGESLAAKIVELVETGRLRQLERERRRVPRELSALLGVPGLGPKRLQQLHERLGVRDLAGLERALASDRLAELPGFGERSVEKLRHGVELYRRRSGRLLLARAEPWAAALRDRLAAAPGTRRVEVAGSYRRRRETVGDLDLVCSSRRPAEAARAFTSFDAVEEVTARGRTRLAVRLRNGLVVDLRLVDAAAFGAALLYFTGSKEHNIALRSRAIERGLKLNEYGAFRGRRRVAGSSEEEIYALLGLAWIPPELRQGRDEIALAAAGRLPRLVELADLRGDLQTHTTATDGRDGVAEMLAAAKALGREYVAITEHSQAVRVAGGLDDRALRAHARRLRAAKLPGIRLLAGVEVDILRDGSLDLAPATLAGLDVVVASVHSHFELPRDQMTRRVVRAVESGLVDVLGHPTGRLIGEREPYELDLEAVVAACVRHGVALEINAHPQRLDLSDADARTAKALGASFVISTDAHSTDELALLRYGVDVARRAGLAANDVLNTLPVERLLAALGRRRRRGRKAR